MNILKTLGLSASRSGFRDNQEEATKNLAGLRPQFKTMQARGTGLVNEFQPQQRAAGQSLINFYNQGPQSLAAMRKRALTGTEDRFNNLAAQTTNRSALTGSDPTATLALLGAKKVQAQLGAGTDFDLQSQGLLERYKQGAMSAAGSLASQGLQQEGAGLSGGMNLENDLYGRYGDMAGADEARQNSGRQMVAGLIGTAAQLYGGGAGAVGAGRAVQSMSESPGRGGMEMSGMGVIEPQGYDFGSPSGAGYFPSSSGAGFSSPQGGISSPVMSQARRIRLKQMGVL
jgi:hypothetical protein